MQLKSQPPMRLDQEYERMFTLVLIPKLNYNEAFTFLLYLTKGEREEACCLSSEISMD